MRKLLLIVLALCPFLAKAQVNTLFEGDSSIVKGVITEKGGYLLKNYDNDGYWSRLGKYYVNYDDSLNILNTIAISNSFFVKYDNKLFTFDPNGDTIDGGLILNPYEVVDSVFLISYDLERGSFNRVKIPRNNIGNACSFTFLEDMKIFAVISAELYFIGGNIEDTNLCLSLIDTAGNVLNHIVYDKKITGFDILEQGDKILVNTIPQKTFFIDKNSWDIVDSLNTYNYLYQTNINDSIFIGVYWDYIYKVNTISKTIDSFYFRRPNIIPSYNMLYGNIMPNDWILTVRNIDTIIYCYRITTNTDAELGIAIENFSQDFNFNGRYTFNEFEPTEMKSVYGVIYTNDGGVILNITTSDDPFASSNAYLLKFYPNGRLSLASVEPDKTAIILYPNPTKDFINIVSSDEIKEITIYNSLSQNVYSKKHKGKDIEIDVSKFSKGNYIVDIKTEKGNIRKKFIVE
ncbi:MAG: T9SS type A sorting domain-containing protein [Bacteroidia bacterium]|nr:T9SS type A sorting domain-containing protein [Bacteroidia bacterium]